jgi:hypothetical protein
MAIALSGGSTNFTSTISASPTANRTLTVPDVTGTINTSGAVNEVPAGSASTPSIYPTGDTNTGIFFPAADTIGFAEGGAEVMRVASDGCVGIATTTPNSFGGLAVRKAVTTANTTNCSFSASDAANSTFDVGHASGVVNLSAQGSALALIAGSSERMRIDTSGNLMVGTTGAQNTGSGRGNFTLNGSSAGAIMNWSSGGANKSYSFQDGTNWSFYNNVNGGNVDITAYSAGVRLSSGGTSWSSLSDERQKDIIEPIENAVSKVGTLRAVIGKYKTDEDGTRRSFLIAQDVQSVLPEAVDAQDIERLSLRYTETIPLLVAAIKELSAELDTVKAQNAAFEARLAALEAK